ncbi:MAG: type I methionyl aminopeptidase [Clostridia bacterium]
MISVKTKRDIAIMRDAGKISQEALMLAGQYVKAGVSTFELDKIMHDYIVKAGAVPSFLGYGGFPATACISVNDVVIHGIPSKKQIIKDGDIVSIDVGAYYKGFHGDNAYTFPCGVVSEEAEKLLNATKESLYRAIEKACEGNRVGDIGSTVEEYAKTCGYSVVRDFVGHGVGANLHEDPSVPNYGKPGRGVRLMPGMTIAIEPMVNQGSHEVFGLDDGWTIKTKDGKLSAHFEHTVAITSNGPVILTAL